MTSDRAVMQLSTWLDDGTMDTIQSWCTRHALPTEYCNEEFIAVFVSFYGIPITVLTEKGQHQRYEAPNRGGHTHEIFLGYHSYSQHYCGFQLITEQTETATMEEANLRMQEAEEMEIQAAIAKVKAQDEEEEQRAIEQAKSQEAADFMLNQVMHELLAVKAKQLQMIEMEESQLAAAHEVESLKMRSKHHLDLFTSAAKEEPRTGVDVPETAVYSAPALLGAHENLARAHQNEIRSEVEKLEIAVYSAPGLANEGLGSEVDISETAVDGVQDIDAQDMGVVHCIPGFLRGPRYAESDDNLGHRFIEPEELTAQNYDYHLLLSEIAADRAQDIRGRKEFKLNESTRPIKIRGVDPGSTLGSSGTVSVPPKFPVREPNEASLVSTPDREKHELQSSRCAGIMEISGDMQSNCECDRRKTQAAAWVLKTLKEYAELLQNTRMTLSTDNRKSRWELTCAGYRYAYCLVKHEKDEHLHQHDLLTLGSYTEEDITHEQLSVELEARIKEVTLECPRETRQDRYKVRSI
jgi:hypothetical protein